MSDKLDYEMYDNLSSLCVGQDVPEFKMETYEPATGSFGEVKLAELKKDEKWTVLVFYPADFTFVCPTEIKAFNDKADDFAKIGCELVGCSVDSHFVHR